MKKFRVEVNGEEFIVNVEEIEAAGTAAKPEKTTSKTAKKAAPKAAPKTPAPTKKAEQAAEKVEKEEAEKSAPVEAGAGDVTAPMPGNIMRINVEEGESVQQGDVLLVLEAMKMENEITASQAGKVAGVNVNVGESVDAGDILVSIK